MPYKKSGTPNGVPDIYLYSTFAKSLTLPIFRNLSLMDSPITRRCWSEVIGSSIFTRPARHNLRLCYLRPVANGLTDNKTLVGVKSLDRPFLRDPQGTTCGCATCDLPLMDSPITRRCLVIHIQYVVYTHSYNPSPLPLKQRHCHLRGYSMALCHRGARGCRYLFSLPCA